MAGERKHSPRGSKAGSDRKVVVDSLGRHPTGLWEESRLRVAGQPGAFGVNFCVGTPSRCGSESRQFSQNCVRLPFLPLSVPPFSFLPFFLSSNLLSHLGYKLTEPWSPGWKRTQMETLSPSFPHKFSRRAGS